MLEGVGPSSAIQGALGALLHETQVDRVYVFRQHSGPEGISLVSQINEVCAEGIDPQIDNPELQNLPLLPNFARWVDTFMRAEPVVGHTAEYPEYERELLEAQGIQSLLTVPILSVGRLLGFIGFDSVRQARSWRETEIDLLWSIADVIATLWTKEEDRRRLNDALERLSAYNVASPSAIIEWCPAFSVLSSNAEADRMFGYEPGELAGLHISVLFPKDSGTPEDRPVWQDALVTEQSESVVWENRKKDGSAILCRWYHAKVHQDAGDPLRTVSFSEDVTAQFHRQARFQALFEKGLDGVVFHDASGQIIQANQAACDILGLSMDQLQGRSSIDPRWKAIRWDGSDFPGEAHPSMVALRTGREVHDELMGIFNPERSRYSWIHVKAIPQFRNGSSEPFQVFTVFRDITEWRELTQRLLESEETFRMFAEQLDESIWIRKLGSGEPVFQNKATESIFGVSVDDYASSHDRFLDMVAPEDRDRVAAQYELYTRGEPFEIEHRIVRPGGEQRWVHSRGFVIPSEMGPPMLAGVLRDVTERRTAMEEVVRARDKAEELSRLKSSLISNVTHELRTPLTGILGFVGLLKDRLENDEEGLEYLSFVESSASRLQNTLESIMEYSVVDAMKIANFPRLISLRATLGDLLDRYRIWAAEKRLSFQVEFPDADALSADPLILKTIVKHLLDNALKFTEVGGIRVAILWHRDELVLKVRDTGIGIEMDLVPLAFQEFRQLSEGMARRYEGNGLGLPIVKRYVDFLGGDVAVSSKEGIETVFTVKLPMAALAGLPHGEAVRHAGILYVEDDPTMQVMVRVCLSGFDVETYPSARAALDGTVGRVFDAVLLDLNLGPAMNGIELCQELRKREELAGVPMAAVTAQTIDSASLAAAGFTHYLRKPFARKDLLSLIDEMTAAMRAMRGSQN